jgi:hypothetical protein
MSRWSRSGFRARLSRMCQPELMGGFDARRYLRMLGEKELADDAPYSPWAGPVDHAAAALVSVGAIGADDARSVLASFGWVDASVEDGSAVGGRRVVALNADVRLPSGVLRLSHALFGADETVIAARYRADPRHTSIHHDWIRVPSNWPSGLQPLLLADDRGAKTLLTFHGSGNDDRWRATLLAESPIASDSSWIELSGTRIPCIAHGPAARVTIAPLRDADPAHRHLWRWLAKSDPVFDQSLPQATVDALVASGALLDDDPVVEQVEAVRRQLPHRHSRRASPSGFRALPDPWPSLIQRSGRTDGPTGLLLVAADTPSFGGHQVAVDVVESGPDGFSVAVRQSPPPGPGLPFRGPVEDRDLTWWARDNHGNHYLAAPDDDRQQLRFPTPLDPLAATLDLIPTAIDCQAIISFPLQWAANNE